MLSLHFAVPNTSHKLINTRNYWNNHKDVVGSQTIGRRGTQLKITNCLATMMNFLILCFFLSNAFIARALQVRTYTPVCSENPTPLELQVVNRFQSVDLNRALELSFAPDAMRGRPSDPNCSRKKIIKKIFGCSARCEFSVKIRVGNFEFVGDITMYYFSINLK